MGTYSLQCRLFTFYNMFSPLLANWTIDQNSMGLEGASLITSVPFGATDELSDRPAAALVMGGGSRCATPAVRRPRRLTDERPRCADG